MYSFLLLSSAGMVILKFEMSMTRRLPIVMPRFSSTPRRKSPVLGAAFQSPAVFTVFPDTKKAALPPAERNVSTAAAVTASTADDHEETLCRIEAADRKFEHFDYEARIRQPGFDVPVIPGAVDDLQRVCIPSCLRSITELEHEAGQVVFEGGGVEEERNDPIFSPVFDKETGPQLPDRRYPSFFDFYLSGGNAERGDRFRIVRGFRVEDAV